MYDRYCISCHLIDSQGVAPAMNRIGPFWPEDHQREVIRKGYKNMPAYSQGFISDASMDDLITYIRSIPASTTEEGVPTPTP